ncbi:helix-turn-helix domain-containing protein [Geodermatophilus sp. SYSU D00705]
MTIPPADPYEGLGDAIKELRLERGATRKEVKDAARISLEYLGKIERGERKPQPDVVARIAAALDTTSTDLLARARGVHAGYHDGLVAGALAVPIGAFATGGLLGASLVSAAQDLRRGADRRRLLEELESRLTALSDEELALLVAAIPHRPDEETPHDDDRG